MKTIPKKTWPDWIKEKLEGRKNVEVKVRNKNFYLYEYRNIWDKNKNAPSKTTWYIGSLIEPQNRMSIREYGNVKLIYDLIEKNLLDLLQEFYPDDWKYILIFSMNRTIYPSPLKRLPSWFEKTALSDLVSIEKITTKRIVKTLTNIGNNIGIQRKFMSHLINENELLMYDGSVIYSYSKYNKLLETGYNKERLLLPKANITLLFSKHRNLPVYLKLFFGSVHEIKTVNEIVEELEDKKIIFVCDKGFYKNKFFEELMVSKIKFINPLPRDDKRIDYSVSLPGLMEYHKRIVKYTMYRTEDICGKPTFIYLYEDQQLKYEETSEFYRLKLAGKKVIFHEEWAGKIALLSNIKINPEEAYLMWKSRDEIEKCFHVLQNILELDTPYISNEDVFRGYVFCSFLALYMYYKILNLIKMKRLLNKISVADVLFEFSKVLVGERNRILEVPKRTRKMLKDLGLKYLITTKWA